MEKRKFEDFLELNNIVIIWCKRDYFVNWGKFSFQGMQKIVVWLSNILFDFQICLIII